MTKRFKRSVLVLTGVTLVALAMAYWVWGDVVGGEPVLRPDHRETVALGREIYRRECASCHGAGLEGEPDWRRRRADGRLPAPPHDQSGHTWHHPDGVLFDLTKQGPVALAGAGYRSDMPGYEGVLSDSEIVAVLSYIKSTWPPQIRARHDRVNAAQGR